MITLTTRSTSKPPSRSTISDASPGVSISPGTPHDKRVLGVLATVLSSAEEYTTHAHGPVRSNHHRQARVSEFVWRLSYSRLHLIDGFP